MHLYATAQQASPQLCTLQLICMSANLVKAFRQDIRKLHTLGSALPLCVCQGNESAASARPEEPLMTLKSSSSSSEFFMPFIPADITPAIERLLLVSLFCLVVDVTRPGVYHYNGNDAHA